MSFSIKLKKIERERERRKRVRSVHLLENHDRMLCERVKTFEIAIYDEEEGEVFFFCCAMNFKKHLRNRSLWKFFCLSLSVLWENLSQSRLDRSKQVARKNVIKPKKRAHAILMTHSMNE
jgi:hypothetical protein